METDLQEQGRDATVDELITEEAEIRKESTQVDQRSGDSSDIHESEKDYMEQNLISKENCEERINKSSGSEQEEEIHESTKEPKEHNVQSVRRTTRERKPPSEWWKICDREKENAHCAMCTEPKTFEEAMKSEYAKKWEHATREEYGSIIQNKTWILRATNRKTKNWMM